MLSEFLEKHAPDYHLPKLERKALVHGHCHHQSVLKMKSDGNLLNPSASIAISRRRLLRHGRLLRVRSHEIRHLEAVGEASSFPP